ncbi:MAG: DUF3256 family protein [Muribaculaceae bacterium]|nr:DUF3256 family protein [Muribaculaceae bacterium]
MKLTKPIALAAALVLGTSACFARLTARQAFTEAPQSVFPLLNLDARLDMIDYFESGMANTSKNAMEGQSRITAMTPDKVSISMSEASDYELCLLPTADGDTAIVVIATVATPAPDSRMSVYSKDWGKNLTSGAFSKPVLSDWLSEEGKERAAEVEGLVPFLLISYSYDPASGVLTLTNNTGRFLSSDIYEIVKPCLKGSITYKWNGKQFVP